MPWQQPVTNKQNTIESPNVASTYGISITVNGPSLCAVVIEAVCNTSKKITERHFRSPETLPYIFECHLIYYVNFLMQEINRSYDGCYDKILVAQRALLSICFGEHVAENRKAFTDAMSHIYPDSPLTPFLSWYVAQSIAAKRLDQSIQLNIDENYKIVDVFLGREVESFLLDIPIEEIQRNHLKKDMLVVILKDNPKSAEIIQRYDHFLSEGRK